MTAPDRDPSHLTQAARRTRRGLTCASLSLVAILLVERAGYAGVYRGAASLPSLLSELVFAIPSLLYLAGLWQLREAVASVASGGAFGGAVTGGLRRLGWCLIAGSALSLLAMPELHHLLGAGYPRLLDFDISTLIIAGVGAGLALVARLLENAAALQSELESFF